MDNIRSEGTENQSVTSKNGEYFCKNVHAKCSKRIRKYPQRYDPGFGAAREWKSDGVASIVYMLHDRDYYSNVYTYEILSLLDEWDVEDCIDET